MDNLTERHLKTGGDPRTLPDYAALRDELNKLTHPARPDVNWPYAEKLCLSLFEHNGVELQTAAWYTLARTHIAGLYGLNEGLAVIAALITRQWGSLWPQPVHARMDILTALSKRLQQVMRTLPLTYTDLSLLYQAEQHLLTLSDVLQRLELKHISQTDELRTLLHNAAARLENSDGTAQSDAVLLPESADATPRTTPPSPADNVKWVYVAKPDIAVATAPPPVKHWKPFAAGMLTMLALGGAALWGWQSLHRPDPLLAEFDASLRLPAPLSAGQVDAVRMNALAADEGIRRTEQQLTRLSALPPGWSLYYGSQLVQQAQRLWPEQAKPLAERWQRQLSAAALPVDNLSGWHQGMTRLQQLADKLNTLDERKGRYLTGSELKTMVYDITQSFNQSVPVEEPLRLLLQTPPGTLPPVALQSQVETALKQLIARYALTEQPAPKK